MDAISILSKLYAFIFDNEVTVNHNRGFLTSFGTTQPRTSSGTISFHFCADDNVEFRTSVILCGVPCYINLIFKPRLKSKTHSIHMEEYGNGHVNTTYEFYDSELLSVHIESDGFLSGYNSTEPFQFTLGMHKYSTEEEQDQFNITLLGYGELIEFYRNVSQQQYKDIVYDEQRYKHFRCFTTLH